VTGEAFSTFSIGWLQARQFMARERLIAKGSEVDIEFLKEQAERCRRLAKGTDPFTEKRLLKLAEEYEEHISKLERKR
jgi:hypothetical protein